MEFFSLLYEIIKINHKYSGRTPTNAINKHEFPSAHCVNKTFTAMFVDYSDSVFNTVFVKSLLKLCLLNLKLNTGTRYFYVL